MKHEKYMVFAVMRLVTNEEDIRKSCELTIHSYNCEFYENV